MGSVFSTKMLSVWLKVGTMDTKDNFPIGKVIATSIQTITDVDFTMLFNAHESIAPDLIN